MQTTDMEIDIEQLSRDLNALEKFMDTLPEKAIGLGVRVVIAAILFFVGSKLIKLIRRITKKSLQRASAETGVIQFLDGLIKVGLYGLLILVIAGNFGFDATGVVALLGSAGVTIGLALQGSLSNLAGGVLILMLKPFKVGDFIAESAHGTEGTVKEIGIFYTRLETPDGKIVVLPNGGLANNSITNASCAPIRRIDLKIGIAYDADLKKAKTVLQNVMDQDIGVMHEEPTFVFVDNLADSAVVLGIRCFCENAKYWDVRWRLLEDAKLALDAAKIEIPFTQVDLHVREQKPEQMEQMIEEND